MWMTIVRTFTHEALSTQIAGLVSGSANETHRAFFSYVIEMTACDAKGEASHFFRPDRFRQRPTRYF